MSSPERRETVPEFTLEQAIELATAAHLGQKDKGSGEPYITHCLRVMRALAPYGKDYQKVGVLHDTIEDSGKIAGSVHVTPAYLLEQSGDPELVADVLAMTKRDDEPYAALILRAKARPRSKLGKLADNLDNSDETRLARFEPARAQEFRQKYETARAILLEGDDWLVAQLPIIKASITAQNLAEE